MLDEIDLEIALVERSFEEKKRRLVFCGSKNFRDLGGYHTADGRAVRWGLLYRSDHLQKLTDADLRQLAALGLGRIIDFRAEYEKEAEPDRLPANTDIRMVEIPILDSTTAIWQDSPDKFIKDNIKDIDPANLLTKTNIELVTRFTPQMRQFINELISGSGRPVLFHCAAGKDRTGFAAALILRILGVPPEAVMEDYLLSNQYYLSAHSWNLFVLQLVRGKRFSAVAKDFLEVQPAYLSAAFETIDREYGSFEKYVHTGLGMSEQDIELLKSIYLE
jgi:protein-tyrosine phosphatase